jgi:hypothetical protein
MKSGTFRFFLAVVAVALWSGCSKGPKELASIAGTMILTESHDVYRMDNSGYYQLAETRGLMKTEFTIDGEKQPAEENTDTELPKTDQGEYDRCKIEKSDDGRVYLIEEARFAGDSEPIEISLRGELEFTEGDWNAYQAGQDVTVRHTEEAHKELIKSVESQFEKMMLRPMEEEIKAAAMLKSGKRSKTSVSSKLNIKEMPNSEMILNKREVRISETRPMTIEVEVRATVGGK